MENVDVQEKSRNRDRFETTLPISIFQKNNVGEQSTIDLNDPQSIDALDFFAFFIRDLQRQLEQNQYSSRIHVYRGQCSYHGI